MTGKLTARERAEARYGGAHLSEERIAAYMEGYRQAVEDAAKVAEKHARNFEAGQGKWASNDIADQIRKLAGREE